MQPDVLETDDDMSRNLVHECSKGRGRSPRLTQLNRAATRSNSIKQQQNATHTTRVRNTSRPPGDRGRRRTCTPSAAHTGAAPLRGRQRHGARAGGQGGVAPQQSWRELHAQIDRRPPQDGARGAAFIRPGQGRGPSARNHEASKGKNAASRRAPRRRSGRPSGSLGSSRTSSKTRRMGARSVWARTSTCGSSR